MKMRMILVLVLFVCGFCGAADYFPDREGYQTLICDLHTHTVFSDGTVWPTVRIDEAKREGIDAISISDHIEYQPHQADIPTNHNRPYEIAAPRAEKAGVLLIKGTEITRDTPPGHYNAIFLQDIDPLDVDGFLDAIEAANKLNGFVFWNHHTWQGEDRGNWEDVQDVMFENGWLHGMEVANGNSYYPQAHRWCLEKGLTMLGNSDIHAPSIDYRYTAQRHRTLTLVFAKERTITGIEDALRKRHTAVWLDNQLIGEEKNLRPLFERMVTVGTREVEDSRILKLKNNALIDLQLVRAGKNGPETNKLPARSSVEFEVAKEVKELKYTVQNLLVAPETGLEVVIHFED